MTALMAFHTATAATFTAFIAAFTMFRNVSDFLYANTKIAISATTASTTRPIGFASITAFRIAWTTVNATVTARTTVIIAEYTFNAAITARTVPSENLKRRVLQHVPQHASGLTGRSERWTSPVPEVRQRRKQLVTDERSDLVQQRQQFLPELFLDL